MAKKKKIFVIPWGMDIGGGEMGKFEDYPDARVFGDQPLAEILGVDRITILRWRERELIPYEPRRGYYEYHVLSVVNALKEAGYAHNSKNNPIATTTFNVDVTQISGDEKRTFNADVTQISGDEKRTIKVRQPKKKSK